MDADTLLEILGLPADAAAVQKALLEVARGRQPELDPDEEDSYVDWVTVNEIGLEFGFEDQAYLKGLDPGLRRESPLILSQLYFYNDTPKTRPFPYALPFGLSFDDQRPTVRAKLAAYEDTRRSYRRDAWNLPAFDLTIAYDQATGQVESLFCHVPYTPWPPSEADAASSVSLEEFVSLFGRRWSDPELRRRLSRFGLDERIGEIRSEHEADFRIEHGLELVFTPAEKAAGDRQTRTLVFAGTKFYASRALDARQWMGPLPFGLQFADSQQAMLERVPAKPASVEDEDRTGMAVWHFATFNLSVEYSNIENHLLRVTMTAPGY